ncbi:NAD(P)/FAD-dependent oxidoreductase [Neolewinella persica]|uniref:NAD(P)/FAD-dependent oxidoreductase n=1 Tax=Neolewinella persica TaxID=70998 RepID=UPI00036E7FAD|nr:FAD-dependent oxidoreductase [Neolewinella persica]
MSEQANDAQTCVIIGASHAGVNLAFNLRIAGWAGDILLFDADPELPYHRPPLSKAYLASDDGLDSHRLKSADSYVQQQITLRLGVKVSKIDPDQKVITLNDDSVQSYDKLVLATGARPLIPPIPGLDAANNCFPLRTAADVENIREAITPAGGKNVVIIGGGYIGLETAASMKKLGANVTVLEREDRVLARVTAPVMSDFFTCLHKDNGVTIAIRKNVSAIESEGSTNLVRCADGSEYPADLIVVGVGIRVNTELAEAAGLKVHNGIQIDATMKTSTDDIYAIGDCTFHHNPHYDRWVRLESVQNAVDQAKVAAKAICGEVVVYDAIPWFWSDQYDVKLQMVGLSEGYDEVVVRHEIGEGHKFSAWYFKGDTLLAVDAVNNAKAYVIGTRFIKSGDLINKGKLADLGVGLKPATLG